MQTSCGTSLRPPVHHTEQSVVLKGLRGALNWAPMMPRDATLSGQQIGVFFSNPWCYDINVCFSCWQANLDPLPLPLNPSIPQCAVIF